MFNISYELNNAIGIRDPRGITAKECIQITAGLSPTQQGNAKNESGELLTMLSSSIEHLLSQR